MDNQTIFSHLTIKDNNASSCSGYTWLTSNKKINITSINPATGDSLANIENGTLENYEELISKAEAAQKMWRSIPAPKRGDIIREIGNRLRDNKVALGHLVSLESGKSLNEGLGEVQEMIDMADFAVGQSRMLYGKTIVSERPMHRLYEQWHSLGVVSIITAFNFPVAVWSWNAFLAAICGNTIIWKPSPKTALCAIAVQHICNAVMKEKNIDGIFSLWVTTDNDYVKHMIKDPRIALVSFTGSSKVGREIHLLTAERFGKVLLELSGNNAVIVDDTANLHLAVPAITFGALGTAGQRCTSIRRVIAHESIYEKLKEALIASYQKIKIGNPLDKHYLVGPLIDAQAVKQFEKTVAAAKEQGGQIIYGGHTIKQAGFFVEPTLIEITNHAAIVQQETFAPILYLICYQQFADAIRLQNTSHFGLSSALFSEYLPNIEAFLSYAGSDCGIACINQSTSGAEIGGAFGGEKATGGGREAGSDAWQAYMRRQTVTINWGDSLSLAQGITFE